ncbi:MAG: helix-turn-helix transcriptional regulator [Roseiarcus sp.]
MWKRNPELAADNLANPVDMEVGGRLRSRRIALNMSAESFARASGTTPQRLREWGAGTSRIGAARLLELTKILDVNPAFFFANERHGGLNGKAGPREARRLDSIFRSEPSVEVFRLIRAFASIESQSSREAVIKFAETKAEKYSESSTSNED